jgi:hypothetical protein
MKDIILGKIDLTGKLEWIKNYDGNNDDEGWHVTQTQDGGFMVSGFTTDGNLVNYSKNIKVDQKGNIVWQYDRLQQKVEYGINSTLEEVDGSFLSAHTVLNTNTGKTQIELYRLSKSGQFLISKIFESNVNMEFRSMTKTDCGYAITFSSWIQRNKSDISIIFTDENLNEIKKLNINKPGKDDAWKTTYKNNRIIVSGSTTNELNNSLDGIFAVIDVGDCREKNIECINIKITEDAAIGYHDFLNTSSTNYGNAIQNAAYAIPGSFGGLNVNRALLKFDLPKKLDSVKIISAKLNLFATGALGILEGHSINDDEGLIQIVTENWKKNEVTWDNQPATNTNNQIAIKYPKTPIEDYNINIMSILPDLLVQNNGVMLRLKNETLINAYLFCSSDFPDNSKFPTAEICYEIQKKDTIVTSVCNYKYFPNPTFNELFIDFNDSKDFVNASCDLFAANGMFIKSQKITTPITVIPCYELPNGMYFIILKNTNCENVIKFEVIKN